MLFSQRLKFFKMLAWQLYNFNAFQKYKCIAVQRMCHVHEWLLIRIQESRKGEGAKYREIQLKNLNDVLLYDHFSSLLFPEFLSPWQQAARDDQVPEY